MAAYFINDGAVPVLFSICEKFPQMEQTVIGNRFAK